MSLSRLKVDAEYRDVLASILEKRRSRPRSRRDDAIARTQDVYACFADIPIVFTNNDDIQRSVHEINSYDGAKISIYRFQLAKPLDAAATDTLKPAVLHVHGGGMFMGCVEENIPSICTYIRHTKLDFFSVEYRLAPAHRHPTPVEDCYAALSWLFSNARALNVNAHRIVLLGESAGGGLAAAVSLLARDRALSPRIAKQLLVYPMLDDRTLSGDAQLGAAALLDYDDNTVGWTALLGAQAGTEDTSPYAAPARASSVQDLPPTYMDVGGLDIFLPEISCFANRLAAVNNELELHIYPGIPHGFEALNPTSKVAQQAFVNRVHALRGV